MMGLGVLVMTGLGVLVIRELVVEKTALVSAVNVINPNKEIESSLSRLVSSQSNTILFD